MLWKSIAYEITNHEIPNDVDESSYRSPYGPKQRAKSVQFGLVTHSNVPGSFTINFDYK